MNTVHQRESWADLSTNTKRFRRPVINLWSEWWNGHRRKRRCPISTNGLVGSFVWSIDWLTDWLIDWLTIGLGWLVDWLVGLVCLFFFFNYGLPFLSWYNRDYHLESVHGWRHFEDRKCWWWTLGRFILEQEFCIWRLCNIMVAMVHKK